MEEWEIQWEFAPPEASHHGDLYERQIRNIRKALHGLFLPYHRNPSDNEFLTCMFHVSFRASPVIRIVKLFTQHVVRGDYWVPTNCSLTVNGGVASLIAWLDHSCQKTEVGGKQGHAPCRRILLQ